MLEPFGRFTTSVVFSIALVGTLLLPSAIAQASEDVVRGTVTYADADRALDGQVLLWSPSYTAGLKRVREIDVLAYRQGRSRATFVGSTYGTRAPSFTLAQKGSATPWAATPVQHSSERLVETIPVRIGPPGAQRPARARVYANCGIAENVATRRCDRADIERFGGALVLMARTTSGGVPEATDIRIDSNGLTYQQLLRVARGLRPAS